MSSIVALFLTNEKDFTASFQIFFSSGATIIITTCALLFGYGTILGNNFNGSQCFSFLTTNRGTRRYHVFTCLIVFLGAIANVELLWAIVDFFIVPVVLINILALAWITIKKPFAMIHPKTK